MKKLRIRELRERQKLTQEQVGHALGVTNVTVSRWESGEREPGASEILALARAFKVHPGEIFAPLPSQARPPNKDRERAADLAGRMSSEERALWFQVGDQMAQSQRPKPRRSPRRRKSES